MGDLNLKPGGTSQMDVDIGKQIEKDSKRSIFKKKQTAGPMGVTNISKKPIRINISDDVKKFLLLIVECVIVGALLTVMFNNFGFRISVMDFLAWIIAWWIIRFKAPEIIRSYRK